MEGLTLLGTRMMSAFFALLILFIVVFTGTYVFGTAIFLVSILCLFEFYSALQNVNYHPIKWVGYLSTLLLVYITFQDCFNFNVSPSMLFNYMFLLMFIGFAVMSLYIIFFNGKTNLCDIAMTIFGIIYISFLMSFVILTRNLYYGLDFLWIVLFGAWGTDSFAYFAGVYLGENKILPAISPKKTLEGAIGGIIGCTILTTLYGWILIKYGFIRPTYLYHFIILGCLNGIISQVGDWFASAIKRFTKVKDFGSIMPGHGGVLDRFDSVLFVAPVVYLYVSFFIN